MSVSVHPIVFMISAPSGSGKSTLVNKALKLVPDLDFSISYTTRQRRGSEQNGKEYYFVSRDEFENMITSDEFLEHANVFGNYYGTARRFLREAGQKNHDLLLDIDVQGAEQMKRKLPEAVSIFVLPPDRQTLEQRLRHRSEDTDEVIERRLAAATREIGEYDRYDYVLVNDQIEKSIQRLEAIVISERLRREQRTLSNEEAAIVARAERLRLANLKDKVRPILDSFRNLPSSAQL
jgi:guanylate kinase